ncbi:hypothetical protein GCM10022281_05310 [Sphingomonas rosea]|uniref:Autotransporter domain-containing protein n=1 Tax=Sphingomonas rosea TaxID=335605 RepID=A0ABP7TNW6_9SPHN
MTNNTKLKLLGTASVAAAAFVLPSAAAAQSTTCTLATGTTYNCVNGTTAVSTVNVTSGTFSATAPLTISSSTGNIVATATPVSGGVIQNVDNISTQNGLTLSNTFAGGSIQLNAANQAFLTSGIDVDAIDFSANGGPVTITTGNITTTGDNSYGVIGSGGTTTAITTGNISTTGGTASLAASVDGTGAITFTSGTVNSAGGGLVLTSSGGPVTLTSGAISANYQGAYLTGTGVSFTGNGVTTTNGDAVFAGATTGNVVLRTGAVSAANSTATQKVAINAATTTGNIDIGTCPTVTTTGDLTPGIVANSSSGNIVINCGTISTTGASSQGVLVGNNAQTTGTVGVTVGGVTTTGANSSAIQINSAGPVTVANTGTINVSGDNSLGIDVATTGTGAVNVTTGVVTSTAANVAASPSFGAVRVVAAGAAPVSVTANGNISSTNGSGIWAQTAGAATVTVNSGVTVSAPTAVTLGGTTGNTLIVNGTIQSTTAGNPAYVVAGSGPLALTIGATGTIAGPLAFTAGNDSFTNNRTAGYTQSGALSFGDGNDTFTNTTTFTQNAAINFGIGNDALVNSGVLNLNGTTDFGAGTDSFTNNAGGTVNTTGALTLLGLETLTNAGTFNKTQAVTFDAGNTAVTNSGTFNLTGTMDFGAGTDSFTNAAGGTVNTTGATTLLGLETLTNAGTFNQTAALTFDGGNTTVNNSGIRNTVGVTDYGAGTDAFNNSGTVNVFGGAASFVGLEAFNNQATGLIDLRDGAANDTFTIGGNYVATAGARLGIDVVGVNNLLTSDRLIINGTTTGTTSVLANVTNPVIDPIGTLVVDSLNNDITAGAFTLGGTTGIGLINYGLETRSGDVYFVARPGLAVADQLIASRLANDIWYQSADAYNAYALSRRVDYGNERKHPLGIWAQLYSSRDRSGDQDRTISAFSTTLTTDGRFKTHRRGAQGGLDIGLPNLLVGVTAGYEHARGDSAYATALEAEGYNYGAYAQFGAKQGPYAGVLLKRDTYDLTITNNVLGIAFSRPKGRSTGIDGEAGFRFGNPNGVNFDAGAGLSYVRSRVDDYSFGGVFFDNRTNTSTRGRLQARATFAGVIAPFVDGKVFHEFSDPADLRVASGSLSSDFADSKRGTWGRVEAGIGGGAGGGPLLSAWVDFGDVKGWGLRGGFRF